MHRRRRESCLAAFLILVAEMVQATATEPAVPTADSTQYDAVYGHGSDQLVVATGSPGELGLLEVLAELFSQEEDVRVCWKKAGSGASLRLLHDRQIDVALVHAPATEEEAVREGRASHRTLIGSNEFFIVGPEDDPAGIRTVKSAVQAYRRIAAAEAKFFSRGDNSGTHKREQQIWQRAGIAPRGDWYLVTRDFMTATLRRAHAEKGYFMTDSSTWFMERDKLPGLQLLFRGDPVLVNVYHGLCQPSEKTAAASVAVKFLEFLASDKAQEIIRRYGEDKCKAALYHNAKSVTESPGP